MGLATYRKKRNFKKTKEPQDGVRSKKNPIFVVQEHHASHLHYDFRLEAFGVLKSWAVPKGPSTDVGDKRLAVEVEDHPLAYAKFKGRIPEGEYGAGTVKIWDVGHWLPPPELRKALASGHLEFELTGKKLKGRWLLQRTGSKTGKKNQWLLIKRHELVKKKEIIIPKTTNKKEAWPKVIKPQLAQLSEKVPQGNDWLHEIKFDGYRTITTLKNKSVHFLTRNNLDWTKKYQPLDQEFKKLKIDNAIFDGEIVVLDDKGHTSFSELQEALTNRDAASLVYYLFDLLYLNGKDLRESPLEERKQLLKKVLAQSKSKKLIFSEHFRTDGEVLLKAACAEGLEGIISKDRKGVYREGRFADWQKIKCSKRQELVIGGFTDPEGSRNGFGALLMGAYEDHQLRYVGKVGTGFSENSLSALSKKIAALETTTNPFSIGAPKKTRGVHWVKPLLVAEIEFGSWTSDKILRHASFQGLRADKKAKAVKIETVSMEMKTKKQKTTPNEKEFRITHPERLIYPKQKITKLDVLNYYKSVSPWLLQYTGDRPLSLLRCPDTAGKTCFFQKHNTNLKLTEVQGAKAKDQKVMYINSEEGLLQLAQWGAIEFHSWQCHQKKIMNPDQLVFDLDPDEKLDWKNVKAAALRLKKLLEALQLKSFLKVTGGKGLHLHVPLAPLYTWEQIKSFCKSVCLQLESEYPADYTTNILKKKRNGKIFLDYLRNGFGATAIVPYSLRAKDKPSVAVPLEWKELSQLKAPDAFDMQSVLQRLAKQKKNPWTGFDKLKQKIKVLKLT